MTVKKSNVGLCATFSALLGCGPTAQQSSGGDGDGDAGDSAPKTDVGDSTSTGEGNEDTGANTTCGNGVIDDGEWCYERFVVERNELPDDAFPDEDHLRQVVRAQGSQADVFVIWGGVGLWEVAFNVNAIGPVVRKYHSAGGTYEPSIKLRPAKMAWQGEGRVDFLYWSSEPGPPERVSYAPGPSRIGPEDAANYAVNWSPLISDFSPDRDGLLTPINPDNQGVDWFFAADDGTKLGGLYARELDPDNPQHADPFDFPSSISGPPLVQEFGELTQCTIAFVRTGDMDRDGFEDAHVYGQDCPSGGPDQLVTLYADGQGALNPVSEVAELMPSGRVHTFEVIDLDEDGWSDVVVVGDGFLQVAFNEQGKLAPLRSLASMPEVSVPFLSFPEQEGTALPLEFGQFDGKPGLEVLVHTADGVTVVSAAEGVLHSYTGEKSIRSYAAADVNADSISDIAVLDVDATAVFFVSNP